MPLKKKKSSVVSYVLFTLLMIAIVWPNGRIFLQQQLMKIGFFQPELSKDVPEQLAEDVATTEAISMDKAIFVNEANERFDTEQLKGKVLFINFWATLCPPCKAEMPSIETLYNKFKGNDKVEFLLVEIENDIDGANKFLQQQNLNLPIVYPNSSIPNEWLSGAIPTTVILDKNGELAGREQGMRDYSAKSIEDFIQNLINQ